jgi:hypothetical protein
MSEKVVQSHTTLLQRRQFNAIRRLANPYPPTGAHERLGKIADIATGAAKPEIVIQPLSTDLKERLIAGAASRSPRAGQKPAEPEVKAEPEVESPDGDEPESDESEGDGKKRKAKKERDRREPRGFDRTTDVNV